MLTFTYDFSCRTAALSTAIQEKFPKFVGSVTEDSQTPNRIIIRIDSGISEQDKPILDEIVRRVCVPDKNPNHTAFCKKIEQDNRMVHGRTSEPDRVFHYGLQRNVTDCDCSCHM